MLLEVWFALVIEQVMRVRRPDTPHGGGAAWRAPSDGLVSRALELVANSRLARDSFSVASAVEIDSDIEDVVYVSYLVDAARLEPFVPEGLELQRVGAKREHAVFSMLTYRHGHFGPAMLGPMRLLPSPVQSNWRTYVRDPRTKREGIYFVTNCVTSAAYAIGARLVAEGMPMHLLARGEVSRDGDDTISVKLDAGARGTAPDLEASLTVASRRELPESWRACFCSRCSRTSSAGSPCRRCRGRRPRAPRSTSASRSRRACRSRVASRRAPLGDPVGDAQAAHASSSAPSRSASRPMARDRW